MLKRVLIGKAAEVNTALEVAESSDYEHVTLVILRVYELVPEDFFDHWFRSKKLDKSFFFLIHVKSFC